MSGPQSAARIELAEAVGQLKEAPCEICGLKYPPAGMLFHHVDPKAKEGEISQVINTWPQERIEAEIVKCALLCTSCHTRLHRKLYNADYSRVRKGPAKHSPRKARELARALEEEGRPVVFQHKWRYLTGTLYGMPREPTIDEVIGDANRAVEHARSTRRAHARKSSIGSAQREQDLKIALERIRRAIKPLRRRIGRLTYLSHSSDAERLEMASKELQKERRKLWKMQSPRLRKRKQTEKSGREKRKAAAQGATAFC